jgi:hypothetical protein
MQQERGLHWFLKVTVEENRFHSAGGNGIHGAAKNPLDRVLQGSVFRRQS